MLTKPATTNGPAVGQPPASGQDEALRAVALKRLERVRRFKLNVAIFLVGMPVLTGIWALAEYMNAHGWPERFSDSAGPGSWNLWILWVLLIWGGILAIQGVRAYLGRPPTESEIEAEVARLKARL